MTSQTPMISIYTTRSNPSKVLKERAEIVLVIVPQDEELARLCRPVVWNVWTFEPTAEQEHNVQVPVSNSIAPTVIEDDSITDMYADYSADIGSEQYIAIAQAPARCYNELHKSIPKAYHAVVNKCANEEKFLVLGGTSEPPYYVPLLVLPKIEPEQTFVFQVPSMIQAYALSGSDEYHVLTDEEWTSIAGMSLIGSIDMRRLGSDIHCHLYSGEDNKPVIDVSFRATSPSPPASPPFYRTPEFGSPLHTPKELSPPRTPPVWSTPKFLDTMELAPIKPEPSPPCTPPLSPIK